MSVVPPPISIKQTPSSICSSVNTAEADANGSKSKSINSNPAISTLISMLRVELTFPVITCQLASKRLPITPIGLFLIGTFWST